VLYDYAKQDYRTEDLLRDVARFLTGVSLGGFESGAAPGVPQGVQMPAAG
jgi:hypothetical protein